jgi:hypothetical protein
MVGAVVPNLCLIVLNDAPPGQHQDEPGAEDISGGQRAGLGNTAEFQLLVFAEHHTIDGHTCLDVSRTSNVYSATGH